MTLLQMMTLWLNVAGAFLNAFFAWDTFGRGHVGWMVFHVCVAGICAVIVALIFLATTELP